MPVDMMYNSYGNVTMQNTKDEAVLHDHKIVYHFLDQSNLCTEQVSSSLYQNNNGLT
jgi:hypothetical protein